MKKEKPQRSPLFYVGDKYKLMPQLRRLFPKNISSYIEPFVGGGSSFLNTKAENYLLNDENAHVVALHEFLSEHSGKENMLFDKLFELIDDYELSCSFRDINVPNELKRKYVKTYYSHFNKNGYIKLRADYNENNDIAKLYLLLIYGFNHMIRFNSSGLFNLPVGNVDFNKNVYTAILGYLDFTKNKEIKFANLDFEDFINKVNFDRNSFVYLDPPYLISNSEYNKEWSEGDEVRLYKLLDELNDEGIKFGLSNLMSHKGNFNPYLCEWAEKYYVFNVKSNYISFNDNSIKKGSEEVFVTNYGKE